MERGHPWVDARTRLARALIAQTGTTDPLVLDAGCGTGSFATSLAAEGVRVVAVDAEMWPPDHDTGVESDAGPAGAGATSARRPQFARADVTSLPFAADTFDLVLLLDVLEHVEDERAALAEAGRVLRPGGSLLLTVPALKRLWSQRDELAGHVRRYELPELNDALALAGFSVERIGYWAATTLPLVTASRWLSRRGTRLLAAEERPPVALSGLLGPVLRFDVDRALGSGWRSGSSLFAVGRRAS
jgi:SAM-dependent methyltransferase